MEPHEIEIVRRSAEAVAKAAIPVTNAFYTNLFATAPAVRPLFPDDMFGQSEKLWASIVVVVQSLDNLDTLRPVLRELGARHVGYGAQPEHYGLVTETLIETLAATMDQQWTHAHTLAWRKVLDTVTEMMLEGTEVVAA